MTATRAFCAFGLEPFPTIHQGDDLPEAITTLLGEQGQRLLDGDIIVVASKVVSIAEKRYVDLATVTPSPQAREISEQTGKPAPIVHLILEESTEHFLATPTGPIIARHTLGYHLTSAGVDRAGATGAWLLPANPDASARRLRDALTAATGAKLAVIIADSDGRADRLGATVISLGAAGIAPLRVTEHAEPNGEVTRQEETFTDLIAAAAGIVLGQRGRGAPVVIIRGVTYHNSDNGVTSILHQ